MNAEDIYESVRSGVADAMDKATESTRRLMRITEFDAVDDDDSPMRVVGIVDHGEEDRQFLCIVEVDGEMFPVIRGSAWRPLKA